MNTRPLSVITGASSGIGLELAKQFARDGHDLVIADRSEKLDEARLELEALGANVIAVKVDLATYKGVEKLFQVLSEQHRPLDAAAINAGVAVGGGFLETSLEEEIKMINLNVVSSVHLAKRVFQMMSLEKRGRILFTSSISATMPGPFEAVYSATKAFIYSFAEALRNEGKDFGISVTVLMPGPTNTELFHKGHMDDTLVGSELKNENDPADVARAGYEALMSGREVVIAATLKTKVLGFANKFLPESWKAAAHRFISEPNSTGHQ